MYPGAGGLEPKYLLFWMKKENQIFLQTLLMGVFHSELKQLC
jgi:hypothetical protein